MICRACKVDKADDEFPFGNPDKHGVLRYRRTLCRTCKYMRERMAREANPVFSKRYNDHQKRLYENNRVFYKMRAYQSVDRRLGRKSITRQECIELLHDASCFYCGCDDLNQLGLDRIDNALGHEVANVVPCCSKCNNILGDIPYAAKLKLKDGLRAIAEEGLLADWTIPTVRRKESKHDE